MEGRGSGETPPQTPTEGGDKTLEGRDEGGAIGGLEKSVRTRHPEVRVRAVPGLHRPLGSVSCGIRRTYCTSGERNEREGRV